MPTRAAANSAGDSVLAPCAAAKPPSSSGFIRAGNSGSVAAAPIMPSSASGEHLRVRPHVREQPQVQLAALLAQVFHFRRERTRFTNSLASGLPFFAASSIQA